MNPQIQKIVLETVRRRIDEGAASLTVGEVMEIAGLSRTSFYANFENLDQVYGALENELTEAFYRQSYNALIREEPDGSPLASCLCANRRLIRFLTTPPRGRRFLEKLQRGGSHLAAALLSYFHIQADETVRNLLDIVLQGTLQVLLKYGLADDPQKAAETVVSGSRLFRAVRDMAPGPLPPPAGPHHP